MFHPFEKKFYSFFFFVSVIISKFTFFQVEVKLVCSDSIQLAHPSLSKTPKGFYSIYMILSSCKFIFGVKYSVMLISVKDQSIITGPTIRVYRWSFKYFSLYDWHKWVSTTIRNNSDIHISVSFKKSKYWGFSGSSSSSFSTNSSCSKVTLIYFKLSKFLSKRTWFFYGYTNDFFPEDVIVSIDSITRDLKNFCCLSGCKIF